MRNIGKINRCFNRNYLPLRLQNSRYSSFPHGVIGKRFSQQGLLGGIRISACLHITTKTANLARTLKSAGADIVLCASNPLSTQDDVAAALVKYYKIPVYAVRGETTEQYYQQINAALDHRPLITMDVISLKTPRFAINPTYDYNVIHCSHTKRYRHGCNQHKTST
ncbi:Adenosylhomocysteinase [hydrothermal vent metagenome]|uniref:Adenosylhomocysteinase n=1 Tax=hydrothermal vent metagenome TaxID=652676 RepID=A0A3B1B2D0_9ZZZZ